MKKLTILILLLAPFATVGAISTYKNVKEIRDANWIIDNGKETLTKVYKIEDGKTTCYLAKGSGYSQSVAIDCVTEK